MEEVDAQHIAGALGELVDGSRREHGEDAPALAKLERPEVAEQPLDVSPQLRVEEHAVPPLQHDLAELHENARLHVAKGR